MSTTGTPTRSSSGSAGPLRPAPLPTGAGTVGWLGPLLALLLIGVAVVLGQDAWTRLRSGGSGSTSTWLGSVVSGLDGMAPSTALAVPAVIAVVLGLVLVGTAFARRSRNALVLQGELGAHLTTGDVARLAAGAARQVDGVLEASASATRRKVVVELSTTGDAATTTAVSEQVTRVLSALAHPPRTATHVKEGTR